ncbi:MAG: Rpn family recombination-promoting nuclease/putative transposase [Muribaculaceae bacterium]|nr:Rpn family recombination-promoting nuclease/putative transposase [Muribaculaceae bacterium]
MSIYIDPFSDIGFKAIFGREGQSEEILREFLNEVFRGQPMFDEIKSVTFINAERTKDREDSKTIIHDILCTTDSGQRFIVEMQKIEQERFLLRAIYYVGRGIADQAKRLPGEKPWTYDLLPVAGVFVTTFPITGLPNKLLLHVGLTDLDTGEMVAKHIRFAFIQTPFFNKSEDECITKFEKIIYTLKNMATLIAIPFQESKDDIFARMEEAAKYASLSPEEKAIYDYELKLARDKESQLQTAHDKGRKESSLEIAKNLKEAGVDPNIIASATNLSLKDIATL